MCGEETEKGYFEERSWWAETRIDTTYQLLRVIGITLATLILC
jgi:hypothetical protein